MKNMIHILLHYIGPLATFFAIGTPLYFLQPSQSISLILSVGTAIFILSTRQSIVGAVDWQDLLVMIIGSTILGILLSVFSGTTWIDIFWRIIITVEVSWLVGKKLSVYNDTMIAETLAAFVFVDCIGLAIFKFIPVTNPLMSWIIGLLIVCAYWMYIRARNTR